MEAATFDLRTGVGRVPDPLDYITKKTACRCAPAGTPHPLWTRFLERITDHNTELQGFLQRYMGSAQQETFPISETRVISPAVPPSGFLRHPHSSGSAIPAWFRS